MSRRIAFLLLVMMLVGCERYRSRAQGPFPRNGMPSVTAAPSVRQPLAMAGPTPPAPPGEMEESPLVPPRPPEPGTTRNVVPPPQAPAKPPEASPFANSDNTLPPRRTPPAPLKSASPQPPAAAAPQPATNFDPLKKLAVATAAKVKTLGNYESHFTRRENVDGTPGTVEEVILKFRAEPLAVYMKNVSEAGKGREVLYHPAQHGEKIHVIVGEGDTRFLKAGTRGPSLSPDNPQIRAKSRHSIRESGVANSANKFIEAIAKLEAGRIPADSMKYAGAVKREEFGDTPLEGVEETVRKGDQGLPSGGTRHWFFDAKPGSPSLGLPVLVILYDGNGKELEYYKYTQFRIPGNFTNADFDPSKMGKK